ncbi:hypothetical protein EGR_01495 [Echinococcus granulosus]|uniref:Uncharacterized protein n=1 Tax=Echinococcus granulosus TaxID=6210 RepID=W6UYW5_ECHGR|nr:hypothetical protein EGR_01495 [Echinococcus granulosus]EUB63872.1 hypothetical protein EGR_01495 [Echinococcus granulosus]
MICNYLQRQKGVNITNLSLIVSFVPKWEDNFVQGVVHVSVWSHHLLLSSVLWIVSSVEYELMSCSAANQSSKSFRVGCKECGFCSRSPNFSMTELPALGETNNADLDVKSTSLDSDDEEMLKEAIGKRKTELGLQAPKYGLLSLKDQLYSKFCTPLIVLNVRQLDKGKNRKTFRNNYAFIIYLVFLQCNAHARKIHFDNTDEFFHIKDRRNMCIMCMSSHIRREI